MKKEKKPTYILFADEYACDGCWNTVEVTRGTKMECEMSASFGFSSGQYRNFEIVSVKEHEKYMEELEKEFNS